MKFLKTSGIVLKEVDTGDADKLIVVLTPDIGKITISAAGARRPRSKFVGGTGVLCYSKFDLCKTRDNYRLNECQIIEPFYGIRNDVLRLTYATYLCEILYDTVVEGCSARRELKLLLNCLHFISEDKKDKELLTAIFELRLMAIMGMAPFLSSCIKCGCEVDNGYRFSFDKCGMVCQNCWDSSAIGREMEILPGTYTALLHIVSQKMEKIFNFNVSKEVLNQIKYITRKFLTERLHKNYRSIELLDKIKGPS